MPIVRLPKSPFPRKAMLILKVKHSLEPCFEFRPLGNSKDFVCSKVFFPLLLQNAVFHLSTKL